MNRISFLREMTITNQNKVARKAMPKSWSVADKTCSLVERRAYALVKILEEMPLYIGQQELIVGTRTILGKLQGMQSGNDVSSFCDEAFPKYINEADITFFGFDEQRLKTHSACGYDILLKLGIKGIIDHAQKQLEKEEVDEKINFLKAVMISYKGLAILIERYAQYAQELLKQEKDEKRQKELQKIINDCKHLTHDPAEDFAQACQLLWFAHLTVVIENCKFMNYGRVDQVLYPYLKDMPLEEAQQYIDCLLLKMYDQVDLKQDYYGTHSSQPNLTIGGITPEGEDAVNPVTYLLIEGKKHTYLPDPQYAVRIHSKNPQVYIEAVCELAVKGINCIAYYNDDIWIESMCKIGIERKHANDYALDLCQDITVAGKGDFCASGDLSLIVALLNYLGEIKQETQWLPFYEGFKQKVIQQVEVSIERYNATLKSFIAFNNGDKKQYIDQVKQGKVGTVLGWGDSLMAPIPFTSALFEGCIETATDLTRMGCTIKHRGFYFMSPTETINSLAAIKYWVYEKKQLTLQQIIKACQTDYVGLEGEIIRNQLMNAPKWGNDEDFVDLLAKDFFETVCGEVPKHHTPDGGIHLAGIHQAHPVGSGFGIGATPDGRKAGKPLSVSLSPANGTMKNGATAAFKSVVKIDPSCYQWNNCFMLQYFSSVFEGDEGIKKFKDLLLTYFAIGGTQHQPNIVDVEQLKQAQKYPENYKNLIVRMWGVSAHFVDLRKDIQDEIIARFM